ncbi:hypothetical protein F4780DRAFT_796854 [Xylariomycetidae sp. FL0641]|nr:hypothetical protein F4780DRAFT_796854 [Xylariomycetidae sp. FL0641]
MGTSSSLTLQRQAKVFSPVLASTPFAPQLLNFENPLRPTAWMLGHIAMAEEETKRFKDSPALFDTEQGFFMESDEDKHELKVWEFLRETMLGPERRKAAGARVDMLSGHGFMHIPSIGGDNIANRLEGKLQARFAKSWRRPPETATELWGDRTLIRWGAGNKLLDLKETETEGLQRFAPHTS